MMRVRAFSSIILSIFIVSTNSTERVYYGAVLEPPAGVISGAGQVDAESFLGYASAMADTTLPLIFMQYKSVEKPAASILDSQKPRFEQIEQRYPWIRVIPQYGISMTHDGSPHKHYEHRVAAGEYDDNVRQICENLKALDRPLFLRIGYECNGSWNGYDAHSYRNAFRHVVDMLRDHDVPAAMVWNVYPPAVPMDYYPGDDYVDWWSIDLFSSSDAGKASTRAFLDSAHAHGKPVMIGESTPRGVGTDDGEQDWSEWFAPYFELIESRSGIKAFSYINWNWAESPWSSWGDARIEANGYIRDAFAAQMRKPLYLHAPGPAEKPSVTLWKCASYPEGRRKDALLVTRTGSAAEELVVRYTLQPLEGTEGATMDSVIIPAHTHSVTRVEPPVNTSSRVGEAIKVEARLSDDDAYTIARPASTHLSAIGTATEGVSRKKRPRTGALPHRSSSSSAQVSIVGLDGRHRQSVSADRLRQNLRHLPCGVHILLRGTTMRVVAGLGHTP